MFIELVYRVVGVITTLSVAMRDERHFARVIENIIGSAGYSLLQSYEKRMMTEEYFSSLFKNALSRNSQQPQKIKDEEKKKEYHEEEPEEEYNDTDSAGDLDGEEILGSDDDEQENPKDYKKVLFRA